MNPADTIQACQLRFRRLKTHRSPEKSPALTREPPGSLCYERGYLSILSHKDARVRTFAVEGPICSNFAPIGG